MISFIKYSRDPSLNNQDRYREVQTGMMYSIILIGVLLTCLVPKSIVPHKLSSFPHLVNVGRVSCLIALLIYLTPESALQGAPFHTFESSARAYLSCNYQVALLTGKENDYASDRSALSMIAHCYYVAYPQEIDNFIQENNLTRENFDNAHNAYLHGKDEVLHFNDSYVEIYSASFEKYLSNYNKSITFGAYALTFWAAIFTGAMLLMLFGKYPWVQKLRQTSKATYRSFKTQEWSPNRFVSMLVPTRSQVVLLVTFSAIVMGLCTYDMTPLKDDPLFGTPTRAALRYYAVRSSCIASWLMPLLILLGGRNNFLQWLTSWDYSTFIMLHRWISRIVMVLVVVHVTSYGLIMGSWEQWKEAYIYAGIAAFVSGVVIMIQGLLSLRRKNYELFLILHIGLALVFVLGAWYHVFDLYCQWFYYVSFAIWAFDRAVRIGRLTSFGVQTSKIEVFEGPDDNTLKVSCSIPENWPVIPGGHAFVHFLWMDTFWQSHPFTYTVLNGELRMYIKVKRGVTYSVYKRLQESQNVKILVEGTYGEKTRAEEYNHAVFIAGGNGIPGIYSEAIALEEQRKGSSIIELVNWQTTLEIKNSLVNLYLTFKDHTDDLQSPMYLHGSTDDMESQLLNKRLDLISLIWVIPDISQLDWFSDELDSLNGTTIKTTIYITRSTVHPKRSYPNITFISGRPEMKKIVEESAEQSTGRTCFIGCGNPVMIDLIREAVSESVGEVEYFEQLQVWA